MTFSNEVKSKINSSYNTVGLADVFYKPILSESNSYKRVSGYFSSQGLDLYSQGLEGLINNGGNVQFIISHSISKEDFQHIQDGYALLKNVKSLKLSEKNDQLNSDAQERLGNLAYMIAAGKAEVKFALTETGIFHDKFGLISSDNEIVYFTGSANETRSGLNSNYESISVDVSWDESKNVQSRIKDSSIRFERLWNNQELGIQVVDASDLVYEEIAKYEPASKIRMVSSESGSNEAEEKSCFMGVTFELIHNRVVRTDNTEKEFVSNDRKLRMGSDLAYYFEDDNQTVRPEVVYKDIEKIISTTQKRADRKNIEVTVSKDVKMFIKRNKYSIEKYKILGDIYKGNLDDFISVKKDEFLNFSDVVQKEVHRPLKDLHLKASFYEYEMARAANFSVPGAGKTAMILGVFAYLNREGVRTNDKINRMLVVAPINAFNSWKKEFCAVFGDKKKLVAIDSQSEKEFEEALKIDWEVSNLVLVNYESLPRYSKVIQSLLNEDTMLIFDEVHRIKNPEGQRAKAALEVSTIPKYKFVLTGTPIPNSYQDVYNFLNILYGNEYNAYFGWSPDELKKPNVREIEEINERIHPFFWRTNKKDLGVPSADADIKEVVAPSNEQVDLAESIYYSEKSGLARLIRLIQASTNPGLLEKEVTYSSMGFEDDGDVRGISESDFNELLNDETDSPVNEAKTYGEFELNSMGSPKFTKGIELIEKLVSEGKKVIV